MTYLEDAAAEVREALDANGTMHASHLQAGADADVLRAIRAERLVIIDRLIAIAAVEAAPAITGDDRQLAARARQLAEDGVRSPEAQALARELLRQLADRAGAAVSDQIKALIATWRQEQAKRLELADGMFTDGNKGYQQGYADALGACVLAAAQITESGR
jgi:hypothetical protein